MASNNGLQLAGKKVFVVLLAGFIIEFIYRVVLCFSFVPETGGSSVNVLFGVSRMLEGRSLYTNPELPPFPFINFMPLHYYTVAGVSQLFGIGERIHSLSVINRLLCLLFNLLIFIPVRRSLKNIFEVTDKKMSWAVFFIIFLLLRSYNFSGPGSLYLLALLFSVYYFLCFLNLYTNKYGAELVLCGIFSSLASFTNQAGFVVQLTIFLFLLIYIKDRKATLRYVLSMGIANLFLAIMLIGSSFNYWLMDLFIQWLHIGALALNSLQYSSPLVLIINSLAFITCILSLIFDSGLTDREKFLRFTIVGITIGSLTGFIFFDSRDDSFAGAIGLSMMLFIISINNDINLKIAQKLYLFALLALIIVGQINDFSTTGKALLADNKSDYENCAVVSDYVKQNVKNDEFIFTIFSSENLMNLQIGEKALFPNRDLVLQKAYPGNVFNYENFIQRYKDGKIKYLVGIEGQQPLKFLDLDFDGYIKETTIKGYDIYVLKLNR